MNKTQELIEKMKENPDRELIFMYPDEGSDYSYTLGYPSKVLVDEYVTIDERVWIKSDEDLAEELAEKIEDELFSYKDFPLNEEQEAVIDKKLEERMKEIKWKKAIVVYIHY